MKSAKFLCVLLLGVHFSAAKINLDDLQPPDHLDAVRMEQDGHLNRDFKKEIFLGNHEECEEGNKADIPKKLTDIFHRFVGSEILFVWRPEL